jgi:hypothetical protein
LLFAGFLATLVVLAIIVLFPDWRNYDGIRGYPVTNNELLLVDKNSEIGGQGGVSLLPPHYQQSKRDITITLLNVKTNKKEKITIFKNIYWFYDPYIIPAGDNKSLWVMLYHNEECDWGTKYYDPSKYYCEDRLYRYDLTTKKLISYPQLIKHKESLYLIPVIADARHDTLWLVSQFEDNSDSDLKERGEKTQILQYNYKYNTSKIYKYNDFLVDYLNYPIRESWGKNFAVDQAGNLYFIPNWSIWQNNSFKGIHVIRPFSSNSVETINTSPYQVNDLSMDVAGGYLYFTGGLDDSNSIFVKKYNVNNSQTIDVGKIVLKENSYIGNGEFIDGKFFLGSTEGIHMYDPKSNKWIVLNKNNGLFDNNIFGVYKFDDNLICMTFRSKDEVSCIRYPLYIYLIKNLILLKLT